MKQFLDAKAPLDDGYVEIPRKAYALRLHEALARSRLRHALNPEGSDLFAGQIHLLGWFVRAITGGFQVPSSTTWSGQ
jgi:hypothetical protein